MRRVLAALVLVLALVTLTLNAAPRAQALSTTVLATLRPGVDLWMPVSNMIPTDANGRLWWGSVPVQTYREMWMTSAGIDASGSHLVVVADATAASDSFYADVWSVGHDDGVISANGWLSGPGQMIYYDRREPTPPNEDGDMRFANRMRFTKLRASGIGSIFGVLYAGTVIREASQYIVARGVPNERGLYSGTTYLDMTIPAGTVLTSSPQ